MQKEDLKYLILILAVSVFMILTVMIARASLHYFPMGPPAEAQKNQKAFEEKRKEAILLGKEHFAHLDGIVCIRKESLPEELLSFSSEIPLAKDRYFLLKDLQKAAEKEGGVFLKKEDTFEGLTQTNLYGYWNETLFADEFGEKTEEMRNEIFLQMASGDVLYMKGGHEVLVPKYGKNRTRLLKFLSDGKKKKDA